MIVFDSSAILSVILREVGATAVRAHFDAAVIGSVNYSEVTARLSRDSDDAVVTQTLAALDLVVIPLDQSLALSAGLMWNFTRSAGLSLGDRCCLALGRRLSCPVLTADHAWLKIAGAVGVEVQLIR